MEAKTLFLSQGKFLAIMAIISNSNAMNSHGCSMTRHYQQCSLIQSAPCSSFSHRSSTKCTMQCISLKSTLEVNDEYSIIDEDECKARSQFGTRQYWDDLYLGRGDFPAEEYSWYFGWEMLQKFVKEYIPDTKAHILCPGIGNDPLLLDLYKARYTRLTAFDYSEYAIDRQQESISFALPSHAMDTLQLHTMDARTMPNGWTDQFDVVIEKGALDAIYLSGEGNVEQTVKELHRVLKPGGICLSISGVVPEEKRVEMFQDWEWLRDGSNELRAGCFVFRNAA